ncbi:hypothetical protein [Ewingella americana]
MNNLVVRSWNDWESLCSHWMKHIANSEHEISTEYQTYGTQGQAQHGVDIFPTLPGCGIVGQCKYYKGRFTYTDLQKELIKSDTYDNKITEYYVLTTADMCTSIQNEMAKGVITHTRPDGAQFKVYVRYWSQLDSINFLPNHVLHKLFPEVNSILRMISVLPPKDAVAFPNPGEFRLKMDKLKTLLKNTFTEDNILWLETWNFRSYKINSEDFDPINAIYLDLALLGLGLKKNDPTKIEICLDTASRIDFYETWPVSKSYLFALENFHKAADDYIGGDYASKTPYLTIEDLPKRDSSAKEMESAALYLANIYRRIVT